MALIAARALLALLALEHIWFLVLEAFLWQRPLGLKTFRLSPADAATTAPLAKNQGLYNGFLAAGLVWGAWVLGPSANGPGDHCPALFFAGCVLIAGVVGAATVNKRIFFVQGLPAIFALAAVCAAT